MVNIDQQQIWFMVASDAAAPFRWEHILDIQASTFWWLRRLPRNFRMAWDGDLILCYRSGNEQRGLVGLAKVEEGFNGDGITVKGIRAFKQMILYDDFKHHPVYKNTEAGRMRNRGTLFGVNHAFVQWVRDMLELNGDIESAAFLQNSIKS